MWEQILAASLGAGAVSWPHGRVLYFEPNDDVIPILRKNISGGERSESHQSKSRLSRYRSAREEDRSAFPRVGITDSGTSTGPLPGVGVVRFVHRTAATCEHSGRAKRRAKYRKEERRWSPRS